jgi:ATP-dependent Clp protease ATP-binding subunit ClpA
MYERFTDRARKVMQLASQESQRLNHGYIGTEHVLLGLVSEGAGVAANVLKNLDVDLAMIRRAVDRIIQPAAEWLMTDHLAQTPRTKNVIQHAISEARGLGHYFVGTEHLLLGLLREEEGVAAVVLVHLGLKLEDVREEILHLLGAVPRLRPLEPRLPSDLVSNSEDLPSEVKRIITELDAQIEQLNRQKEEAVTVSAFEGAAFLRDQADELKQRKSDLLGSWLIQHPIDPTWLSCNGGASAGIARVIKESKRWEDLPILADALEDAGCTDKEMLRHCRQPGKHANRCWVVELLLDNV